MDSSIQLKSSEGPNYKATSQQSFENNSSSILMATFGQQRNQTNSRQHLSGRINEIDDIVIDFGKTETTEF